MGSAVSGLPAILGASGRAGNAERWAALQMLGGTNGTARLVFDSGDGRHCKAKLGRWIAISRPQRSAARAVRFVWLLDARTIRWSGGPPPGDLHRGVTGLDSEEAPILWFRGSGGDNGQRAFTASGVFGAAGITDSARVSVTVGRIRRHCRLRMMINPQMWGLSGCPGTASYTWLHPVLTIMAAGTPRPLEPDAIVSIHGAPRLGVQLTAGSGGSQGFPSMTARTASSAAVPWAAAESR